MDILLLLLLFAMEKDDSLKKTVQDFLKTYRENQDLIRLLRSEMGKTPDVPKENPTSEKESPAPTAQGNEINSILEKILARSGV